jgi:cytochrome P450
MTHAQTKSADWTVPAHVPPELVYDIDYFNVPDVEKDPQAAWLRVRDAAPRIFYTPRNGGHWIVTRASDVQEVLGDAVRFSSYPNAIPRGLLMGPYPQPPTGADPPESLAYRALLMPYFSPGAVKRLEGFVRSLTVELIEELRPRGQCEFVSEFGQRMPIGIFLRIMGLPDSDRKMLIDLAFQRVRGKTQEERLAGLRAVQAYADGVIAERRAAPRDDLLSHIANGQINGTLIPLDQARSMTVTALFAGLDTVVNSLAMTTRHLAVHPEQRRELIDNPELVGPAVDELLRRFSGPNIVRCSKADQEFGGVFMRAGDQILNIVTLTGLDSEAYPSPLEVDFHRGRSPVTGFGAGAHRCVGSHLAKLETQVFLQEWLGRIPEFALDPERPPVGSGGAVPGLVSLSLTWDPATTTARPLGG